MIALAFIILFGLALLALTGWLGYSWGHESGGLDSLSKIVDSLDVIGYEQARQTLVLNDIADNTGRMAQK